MPGDGTQFEALLHQIYTILTRDEQFTTVERDVQLEGPDGTRQIDVLIRASSAGIPLTMVVECRDHSKRLDLTAVDGFQSKIVDVCANKGVLVSRKGFTKNAKKKADRLGITLCTASDAPGILGSLGIQVPIVLTEITTQLANTQARLNLTGEAEFDSSALVRINDRWLPDLLREEILAEQFECPLESCTAKWIPQLLSPPFYIRAVNGDRYIIEEVEYSVVVTASHYFGHLNDLSAAIALHNLSEKKTHVFLKKEDIPNFKHRLVRYSRRADIPDVAAISIAAIAVPEAVQSTSFVARNSNNGELLRATTEYSYDEGRLLK